MSYSYTLKRKGFDSTNSWKGRRSSVNVRGHKIFARKICIKNQQNARILHDSWPKNYQSTRIFMTFVRKIYKIPEFYMIFTRKMPEFYIIIARQIFFPEFFFFFLGGGGMCHPALPPVSYAYRIVRFVVVSASCLERSVRPALFANSSASLLPTSVAWSSWGRTFPSVSWGFPPAHPCRGCCRCRCSCCCCRRCCTTVASSTTFPSFPNASSRPPGLFSSSSYQISPTAAWIPPSKPLLSQILSIVSTLLMSSDPFPLKTLKHRQAKDSFFHKSFLLQSCSAYG